MKAKIGVYWYTISFVPPSHKKLDGARAIVYQDDRIILVDKTRPQNEKPELILHELLHAIRAEYAIEARAREEGNVSRFAVGLNQVLKESPEVRRYLMKCWNGK